MSFFQNFGVFRYNNPEAEVQRSSAQAALNNMTERESMNCLHVGL